MKSEASAAGPGQGTAVARNDDPLAAACGVRKHTGTVPSAFAITSRRRR
jgi:hypothetical protein